MADAPQLSPRAAALLEAHCRSLDPDALTARERLYATIGRDLGRKLVFALAQGGGERSSRAA